MCNTDVGLICLNKNQAVQQQCLDYEISLKCCGTCSGTTTTPTTTTTSTTTQTPTPSVISTSPSTTFPTGCCQWSGWINAGQPTTGPDGGESESIQKIIDSAGIICDNLVQVECRAKEYPLLPLSELGQDVKCNIDVGLICLNKNQGVQQQCLDYEISVKCCAHCGSTTSPTTSTTTTTTPTTTTPTTTTASTTTQTTTTTTPTTTTPTTTSLTTTPQSTTTSTTTTFTIITGSPSPSHPTAPQICFCWFNGTHIKPGMTIYNVTDYDGWCFSAFCNETCGIIKHYGPCGTTVSTTSPTTVHKFDCLKTYPPRKNGESWRTGNCSTNTCDNGTIVVTKKQCKTTKTPMCVNGYSPVKVYDDSGCCFQEECRCLCSGWGDPHYITFDGTYYPFQGNCSYVLVKEIYPKYNFSVIIQNYYCDALDHLSCPQSLTVYYKSYEIMMTQKNINGTFKNLVYVNNKRIIPAYKNSDFSITDNGIDTLLYIPDINAWVSFRGLMFSIDLPYAKFFNNTEGQCGTCDNNQTDDCLLPNGTIISSCPKMANHWKVPDNETCPTPVNPTPPPHPPACNVTICELLKSKVFEKCHKAIPYEPYFEGCSFDVCHMPKPIGCSTLQMYASLCAAAGICVDWRSHTNGECAYKCHAPKVYEPCGPLVEPTCNLRYNKMFFSSGNEYSIIRDMFAEGCYCPPGSTLLSPKSNICMKSCDVCMLPNGQWKEPGSVWTSGCDVCECPSNTLIMDCEPMECPYQPPPHCNQEGQVMVTQDVDCCPKAKCACNTSLCSTRNFTCDVGFTKEIILGPCCPIYICVPMYGVCVFNNTAYQPGESVPEGPCVDCVCGGSTVDPNTKLHAIECTPKVCDLYCSEGYEYQDVAGQCCGTCVQTSCIVHFPSQTVHIVQPGTVWTAPDDPCIKYECAKIGNQFITTEYIKICPFFNPDSCIPGTVKTGPDGCCPTCVQKCNVTTDSTYLVNDGCRSNNQVILTTCKGSCDTSSVYSLQTRTVEHMCSCCQEISTTEKQVEMTCPDGSTFTYTYLYIEQCGCVQNECPATAAASSSILKKP